MNDNFEKNLQSLKIDKSKKKTDRPRSKKWRYLFILLALVIIVIAYFIFKESLEPATQVKTATVTLLSGGDSEAALVASGYVVAQRKAEVASKGTGRLKYLGFEEGDKVAAKVVIAEIENEDIKAQVAVTRANLLRAEADSMDASRILRLRQDLIKSGATTQTELDAAITAFRLASANVAAAEASLMAAEVELENTFIRAPFDGTILTKNADVGEIVAPFASSASSKGSVVTLADMTSLEVEADVSESNIYKVSVGQKCEIILDAYPEIRYPASVKKIVPTADRARATVMTKIAFDEIDRRVLPEMSARINFFEEDKKENVQYQNVLVINNNCITNRNGQKVVFRINGEFSEQVVVTIGRELGEVTEITSGLKQNDRVIIEPPGKMVDNQKIEIVR